jgi:hypothetical protein
MIRQHELQQHDDWTLIVDAPLSSDILDHSGNGNNFSQQSYAPTFNDNALYITGVNRGVTLHNVLQNHWKSFKVEFELKWDHVENSGVFMLGGYRTTSWPNVNHTIGVIRDGGSRGQYYLFQYSGTQYYWPFSDIPTQTWIKLTLTVYGGYVDLEMHRIDNDTQLCSIHTEQKETQGYADYSFRLGGSFDYSEFWPGWIRNFKLYSHS